MRKILFIINPKAGTKSKDRMEKAILGNVDGLQYEYEIVYTGKAGDGVKLAQDAVKKRYFAAVAVGGDGTVNEVARGLVGSGTALGIIPCGSGDGLARHLGISHNPSSAVNALNSGKMVDADYCTINGHPFFCTCGVGFDAFVSLSFTLSGKRGPIIYVEKALESWLKYEPAEYELQADDEPVFKEKAMLITCGNASQWGNEAKITPRASIVDGLLDITIVKPFSPHQVGPLAVRLMNGSIDKSPLTKTFQCKNLVIRRHEEGPVHFDGDPTVMGKELQINVIQKGLRILLPFDKTDY